MLLPLNKFQILLAIFGKYRPLEKMLGVVVFLDVCCEFDILLNMIELMKISPSTHFLFFFIQFEILDG